MECHEQLPLASWSQVPCAGCWGHACRAGTRSCLQPCCNSLLLLLEAPNLLPPLFIMGLSPPRVLHQFISLDQPYIVSLKLLLVWMVSRDPKSSWAESLSLIRWLSLQYLTDSGFLYYWTQLREEHFSVWRLQNLVLRL